MGSILAFRDRVRARLARLYDDVAAGRRKLNRHVARMLAMTLEHEGWHVEVCRAVPLASLCHGVCADRAVLVQTLLYMLIQRAGTGTLPPPGFTPPPWSELAASWDAGVRAPSTPTVTVGLATITMGHEDSEGDDLKPEVTYQVDGHEFG